MAPQGRSAAAWWSASTVAGGMICAAISMKVLRGRQVDSGKRNSYKLDSGGLSTQ